MRVVITGALGHIGSRLTREMPRACPGADIVMLDNLATQRYCSLFDLPPECRYRFRELDVLNADLNEAFDGAHTVVHLAAATDAATSFDRDEQVGRANFLGTERVARACLHTGSALVFASTTSVYGTQTGLVDEDCPADELRPQSPYAESKLKAERLLETLGREEGLRYVACRFGTVFGVSPGMRFHTAINKFCWQAINGLPVTVWRTALQQQRPYLGLGDAVAALIFILRRELFDRRVFNVLSLNATVSDVVEAISARVPDATIRYADSPIMNELSYRVSNRRFAGLGFEFRDQLAQGIGETIRLLQSAAGVPWRVRHRGGD